jgi:hypothetical protein
MNGFLKRWFVPFFGGLFLACAASIPAGAETFDHSAFDKILRRFVSPEGLVDYDGLRKTGAENLQKYLLDLEKANPAPWSGPEKLAFWINAYNAQMIRIILNRPKMKKVSEDFGLFDLKFPVAGGNYSLNDIEHRILRGKKNPLPGVTLEKFDPRIHFALVCAAMDCPKLVKFAYTAENIEATLKENASAFANDPKHLSTQNGRLRISSLMKWYAEDFEAEGGAAAYLSKLTDPAKRPDAVQIDALLSKEFDKAVYEYDWTVNDVKNALKTKK